MPLPSGVAAHNHARNPGPVQCSQSISDIVRSSTQKEKSVPPVSLRKDLSSKAGPC